MTAFARHAALLFLALRAGDLVNLAAGLWLVPRYVAAKDLGAVLPVTSFATCLALPAFAFATTALREASALAARGALGEVRTLMRGVFAGAGVLLALALVAAAALMPRFLASMRVADAAAGFLCLAAAFLGCVAPIYTDALQALKRFRAYAAVEFAAALARLGVLAALMPLRPLAGYFAGGVAQPLARIAGALLATRRGVRAVPAAPYWSAASARHLAVTFAAVLAYLLTPMLAGLAEQSALRTALAPEVSAGYYLATRLSDLLNYLTLPLLVVLFPYAAEAAERGGSPGAVARRCCAVTLAAATALALVLALWGERLLALLPRGAEYAFMAPHLPLLVAICALGACQTFFTNALVAAGRFRFLAWFAPLHLAYAAALPKVAGAQSSLPALLACFALFAALRLALAAHSLKCGHGRDVRAAQDED